MKLHNGKQRVENAMRCLLCVTTIFYFCNWSYAQPIEVNLGNMPSSLECLNYNQPAPPGDDCATAPYFCGSFLEGYCSSNYDLSNDTINGNILKNAGFLRFSPCFDQAQLEITVKNCVNNEGLQFSMMEGPCSDPLLLAPTAIANNQTSTVSFTNLNSDSTYFLVFSSLGTETACEFSIHVVDGIGTAIPGASTCECTAGSISGPTTACPGDMLTYTINPGSCNITVGDPIGGNGYYCCPPFESSADSLHLVWHLPPGMSFTSDSVDVLTITAMVDTTLLGLDSTINGQIWASYEFDVNTNPSASADSLVYCECPKPPCSSGIGALNVQINHNVTHETCIINCVNPFCVIDGVFYPPGVHTIQTNCETKIITVIQDVWIPISYISSSGSLNCVTPLVFIQAGSFGFVYFQWMGPGILGNNTQPSIMVNQPGTYTCIVTNPSNGCTSSSSVNINANFTIPVVDIGADQVVCEGEAVNLSTTNDSEYTYAWSNGENSSSINVSPVQTTTYTVFVTNTVSGCVNSDQVTITVNPSQITNLGVVDTVSCANPCVTYLGNTYCQPGQYSISEDCTTTNFEIEFQKAVQNLGTIGTITCAQNCIMLQGVNYCQSGNYTISDSCNIYNFTVEQNTTPPTYTALTNTCLPTNFTYEVGFNISGTPPYIVNGNAIAEEYFLSEAIPNTTTYSFTVVQANNNCQFTVSGVYDCGIFCTAAPGIMSQAPISVCVGQNAESSLISSPQLIPSFVSEYILHTEPGNMAGTILKRNSNGIFTYDSVIELETTYYISNVVGPALPNGAVDMEDICSKISVGQAVVFHALPESGALTLFQPTCYNDSNGSVEISNPIGKPPFQFALNGTNWTASAKFENLHAGTYYIQMVDANACTTDANFELVNPDSIFVATGTDKEIFKGQIIDIQAFTNVSDHQIQWLNQQNGLEHTGLNWTIQISESNQFTCTVVNDAGCVAADTIMVHVKEGAVFYPNVISLNPVDKTDQWFTIFSMEGFVEKVKRLSIFDRWGNEVFLNSDFLPSEPQSGWNGHFKGKAAPPGVYIFVAVLEYIDGSSEVVKGDVLVVW